MDNRYYALLEELYDCYDISVGTEIATFIKEKLKNNPADVVDSKHIKAILLGLEKDGLATWDAMPIEDSGKPFETIESEKFKGLLGTADDIKYQTFRQIYVEVQLTSKGLDYVQNLINTKTSLSTNKWIKYLTAGLLIVASIAVILQGLQFLQARHKEKRYHKQFPKCSWQSCQNIQHDSVWVHNKDSVIIPLTDTSKKQHK